ncbi:hypothetical protein LJC71_02325 [Desulfosarcina sp. OttesenSCG-928-A07]|nr:hypothetical protein [Desulfosarcina sp. OttesenSCG-928-A07]
MMPNPLPDTGTLTEIVHIPATSPWFSGHFPDQPVFPGVAQLAWVADLVRKHPDLNQTDPSFRVAELRRVRFKRKIVPDDQVTVAVTPAGNQTWLFRLEKPDGLVATGTMVMDRAEPAVCKDIPK